MCGIVGLINFSGFDVPLAYRRLDAALGRLFMRGRMARAAGAIVAARLAIVDLFR